VLQHHGHTRIQAMRMENGEWYLKETESDGSPRKLLTKNDWMALRQSFLVAPSARVINALHRSGFRCLAEAAEFSEGELLGQENFGRKSLNELKSHLRAVGLECAPDPRWCPGCQKMTRWKSQDFLCDSCATSLRPTPHQPWMETCF
jgi:hypothetical protein